MTTKLQVKIKLTPFHEKPSDLLERYWAFPENIFVQMKTGNFKQFVTYF